MTSAGTVRSIFNYTRDAGVEPEIYFYEPPHGARPGEADELLKHRVAFYNFWKPLRGSVEEKPLPMCDVTLFWREMDSNC